MKTKRCIISILICILLLVGFVLTASLLTPKVARAEDEISGDILQPFKDNYNYIGTPTSVCADDENIYIASGDIIYVYGKDYSTCLDAIDMGFSVKKVRIYSQTLYILKGDGEIIYIDTADLIDNDLTKYTPLQNATQVIDFDIVNNNLVFAVQNSDKVTVYHKIFGGAENSFDLDKSSLKNITFFNRNIYFYSGKTVYEIIGTASREIFNDDYLKHLTADNGGLYFSSHQSLNAHSGAEETANKSVLGVGSEIVDICATNGFVYVINKNYDAIVIYSYSDSAGFSEKANISYTFNQDSSLHKPSSVIERNGKIFTLDENSIKIIENDIVIKSYQAPKNNRNGLAVDDNDNIYLLRSNSIDIYSGDESIRTLQNPNNAIILSDITYAIDGNLYALSSNNGTIYRITTEGDFSVFKTGTSASKIATNLKTKKLYALSGSEIFVYSLDSNDTHSISTGIAGTIIDIQTDFNDNIYVLSKTDGNFFLTKLDKSSNFEKAFEPKKIDCSDLPNPDGLCSITINNNNGEVLIADSSQHYILAFSKSNTGTIVSTDIPFIEPETKILSNSFQRENTIVKIGTITGFPSTLFYPIHTDVSSSIFPKNNDNTNKSVTILENGTQVLIVEEIEHDDDTFYYVIANGMAGFVYGDAVSVDRISNFEPIALEPVNQSVVLLSYPSTKTINLKNSYAVVDKNGNQLRAHIDDFELNEDDKQIMFAFSQFTFIENNVATSWYFVSYKGNFCFVDASSVVKSSNLTYSNPFKYARISTGINAGLANVYNDITPTEDSVLAGSLKDNERVKVTWEGENISYIRYQDGQGNTITEGYINNKYILYNGLTTTQLAILILAFSTVLLAVATVVAIKVFKK